MTHPMLERLGRRVPATVSRLGAWVRSLAGRRGRIEGGPAAGGVLVTPPRPRFAPRAPVGAASTVVRVLAHVGFDVRVTRARAAPGSPDPPAANGPRPAAVLATQPPMSHLRTAARTALPLPAPPAPVVLAAAGARPAITATAAVAASRSTVLHLVEDRRRIDGPPWPAPAEPARVPPGRQRRAAPPGPTRSGRRPGAPPRPRTLMVLAPGPAAAVAAAVAAAPPTPVHVYEPEPRGAAPAAAVPAPDVERLTDEVVRQIDRRIAAHRERLGRI